MEYVADQVDIAQRWTAHLRQPLHQRHRRVERRAGKRAEAGDENAKVIAQFGQALSSSCPPTGPAYGRPDDRLRRASSIPELPIGNQNAERRLQDRPLEPVVGRRFAPTRWRAMKTSRWRQRQ